MLERYLENCRKISIQDLVIMKLYKHLHENESRVSNLNLQCDDDWKKISNNIIRRKKAIFVDRSLTTEKLYF